MDHDWLLAVAIFISVALLFSIVLALVPRRNKRPGTADAGGSGDSGGFFSSGDGDSGGNGGGGGGD
jgi:uncharacterized membrane protein YgcG